MPIIFPRYIFMNVLPPDCLPFPFFSLILQLPSSLLLLPPSPSPQSFCFHLIFPYYRCSFLLCLHCSYIVFHIPPLHLSCLLVMFFLTPFLYCFPSSSPVHPPRFVTFHDPILLLPSRTQPLCTHNSVNSYSCSPSDRPCACHFLLTLCIYSSHTCLPSFLLSASPRLPSASLTCILPLPFIPPLVCLLPLLPCLSSVPAPSSLYHLPPHLHPSVYSC